MAVLLESLLERAYCRCHLCDVRYRRPDPEWQDKARARGVPEHQAEDAAYMCRGCLERSPSCATCGELPAVDSPVCCPARVLVSICLPTCWPLGQS